MPCLAIIMRACFGRRHGLLCEHMDFVWQKCLLELSYQIFCFMWWLRWSVLALVNGNCTNLNFENLMCIAVNFYVKSSGHQEALTGLNHRTPFCTSGTNVLWNKCNWTVSNFGQTDACLIIGNLFSMSRSWMTAGGWNEHWNGMLEVAVLWDAPVTKFCRWQNIGEWQVKALWLQYLPDFVTFMHL